MNDLILALVKELLELQPDDISTTDKIEIMVDWGDSQWSSIDSGENDLRSMLRTHGSPVEVKVSQLLRRE